MATAAPLGQDREHVALEPGFGLLRGRTRHRRGEKQGGNGCGAFHARNRRRVLMNQPGLILPAASSIANCGYNDSDRQPSMRFIPSSLFLALIALGTSAAAEPESQFSAADLDFFEKK